MKRSPGIVLSLLLMFFTLLLGIAPSVAQSTQMTHKKAGTKSAQPMAMGAMSQMGRTTKKQRMQAAIRHADRRAAHIRKHGAEVK